VAEKRRSRHDAPAPTEGGPSGRLHKKPRRETLELLSANIRALRKVAQWSQDQLAHESGLGRSYVGDIERCRHNPRLSTLEALADALGVRTAELLEPVGKGKRGTR
jgi:ribosome-binding protein aMBF1 (putative translation factor)